MEVVNTARMRQDIANSERLTRESKGEEGGGKEDTWVFPLVQMKPLGLQVDEQVTQVGTQTCPWIPLPSPTNIGQITPIAHVILECFCLFSSFVTKKCKCGHYICTSPIFLAAFAD